MDTSNSHSQKILLETIFQHIPQFIFWKNTHSVYLGCNHKHAELLGLNHPPDIIGKTDYEIGWLPDGDTADKFRTGDQETLAGRAITNQEEWLSLKTGAKILTLTSKVPLLNANGSIQGILGVATDITEKKRIEENLAKTHHQLKGMTIVSASIAHELRTPLASLKSAALGIKQQVSLLIAGYQTAVAHQLDVPKLAAAKLVLLQQVLDGLENKVDECNRVITMLLANISANREQKLTAVKKCSVKQAIIQALAQYGFPGRGTPEIIWDETEDFIFYGQEILLVHVLSNLLKNALYFIQKAGKGHILIWIERAEQYDAIHFKDTGMGIAPENLPKIFEPFFTVGTNKGTGVGLAFCDITLQLLGGTITCQSQWREYTEFILKFPKKIHDQKRNIE